MSKSPGIRLRLVTIVLLGVITSALSLLGLVRILSVTTANRLERSREAMSEELDRRASQTAPPSVVAPAALIGEHGGVVAPGEHPSLDPALARPIADAIDASAAERGVVEKEMPLGDATLIVMARPAAGGRTAWSAFLIAPPTYLPFWRAIVILLAFATTLLVISATYAVITMTKGAAELNRSLVALATDLKAPIPRPAMRELAEIAEGVSGLAESLAASRATEAVLSRELAAKERLAALGRVVAGVAHEVRNPLASIKLRLDLAASSKNPASTVMQQAIGHASSEISRLDRLVADLLVVAGRATGPRKRQSLGALCRARAEVMMPWANARGSAIVVEGDTSADFDADALARAVDNLLRNAVEAAPKGTPVVARVERSAGRARVTIEDQGKGVAAGRQAELFEPFFTTKPDGTGLGLALSRAIARAHGGDVIYARAGATTRFVLTVDGNRAEAATTKGEKAA